MIDVAVVGGGAAGMATAIMIKRLAPPLRITILEGADRVCKKLAVTGNGRCNISNSCPSKEHYHGDAQLAQRLLEQFGFEAQRQFFLSLGVPLVLEEEGKAYPMSLQASSVADALRYEAAELGIDIRLGCKVLGASRLRYGFELQTGEGSIKAKVLVVAAGGKAGGKLGSESGYGLLKSFGHKIEPIFPSLVQLKTDTTLVRQLKGIKVKGSVRLISSLGSRCEKGEILFADYGISGPPVLQVSRLAQGDKPLAVLDLLPELQQNEIAEHLITMARRHPQRPAGELFAGFINKRLGQVLLKKCGGSINEPAGNLANSTLNALAAAIKRFELPVLGTTDYPNAQVTAGGAQTAQFFDTLMSKKAKGLFAVGEVLNVDGDCGGYNLAFCWACANAAAKGVTAYLEETACL